MEEDQPPKKWIPFELEEMEEKESQEHDVMKMAKEDNEKLLDQKHDKYIKKVYPVKTPDYKPRKK